MLLPKNMKLYAGIAIFVLVLIVIIIYRRSTQSKYVYSDIKLGTTPPETTTVSNIISCQVAYNTANVTATDATRPGFLTIFNNCIRSNVGLYVDTKCPWINSDPTAANVAEYSAFTQYTNDQNAIQAAYVDLFTRSSDTTSPTLETVEAALKADLTGATRRYLSTVCPAYFKTPGYDPTTTYSNWTVVPSTSAAPTTYSFWANGGKITAAQVNTWATKAVRYTVDQTTYETTTGTPYAATGSTWNADTTTVDPNATPAGTYYKNWEFARDNGPGTINGQF
jgi:hypothetical protein